MPPKRPMDSKQRADVLERLKREHLQRQGSYREQALRVHPHICAKCSREFEGKRLRELTVHHKDSNPENNPSDGSNWELLCIYCHENEHSRETDAQWLGKPGSQNSSTSPLNSPFAGLAEMLKKK
ncbi:MAG: YajD family HNH nuclease [Desulfovibrionales bacterium]